MVKMNSKLLIELGLIQKKLKEEKYKKGDDPNVDKLIEKFLCGDCSGFKKSNPAISALKNYLYICECRNPK